MNGPDNPVREAREHLNMTQRELADEIGCSERTISRYEQGAPVRPPMRRLLRLLMAKRRGPVFK